MCNYDGKDIYNIAFGDVTETDTINDINESNNGDIIKVITTVMAAIYDYTSLFPERNIFFHGSTIQRTNFYKNILRRKHDILVPDFNIYGIIKTISGNYKENFDITEDNYVAFIIERKIK